jgi:hypothetical protein
VATVTPKLPYVKLARYLRAENAKWPEILVSVAREQWPDTGPPVPAAVYRSSRFLAQLFQELDGSVRISINRTAIDRDGYWLADLSWDELQELKRQLGFGDRLAVEVYPRDKDVANMRHLWVMPPGFEIGWRKP